jgi:hypothetical protein
MQHFSAGIAKTKFVAILKFHLLKILFLSSVSRKTKISGSPSGTRSGRPAKGAQAAKPQVEADEEDPSSTNSQASSKSSSPSYSVASTQLSGVSSSTLARFTSSISRKSGMYRKKLHVSLWYGSGSGSCYFRH